MKLKFSTSTNILWIDTCNMATQVLKTLCQSCTVELASKAFSTSNTWPETSYLGNTNYTGPLLKQFL